MTVADVIKSALRQLGKIPVGESYPAAWDADMLAEINAMLQHWAVEGLKLHAMIPTPAKTLTVGDPSYTIGASADMNTRRPVEIVAAILTLSGVDYPIAKIRNAILDYLPYQNKTQQGRPTELYYDAAYSAALGTVWLYPAPDQPYSLVLHALTSITPFAATTETIALPPEYEYALAVNFAAHLLSVYGETNTEILRKAGEAKAALHTNNSKRLVRSVSVDPALLYASHGGYSLWDMTQG